MALTRENTTPHITVVVTPGLPQADRIASDLTLLTRDDRLGAYPVRVLEFPPKLDGDKAALGVRLKTLAALRAWAVSPYPAIVIVSCTALTDALPGMSTPVLHLAPGHANCRHAELQEKLASFGYARVPAVEQEGDYSVRGGIIDAWSPGEAYPVRAEFFGDLLESIRLFDPATQTSIKRTDSAEFVSLRENEPDAATVKAPASLFGLIPPDSTLLVLEHNDCSFAIPNVGRVLYTGDPPPEGVPTAPFTTSPLPGFSELSSSEAHHPELFESARQRLTRHLESAERRGTRILRLDDLSGGFETPGLVVVTKSDRVFTRQRIRRHTEHAHGSRLNDFDDLEPGEYVVHVNYGVGRYIGSSEILINGTRQEVFTVEYAEGAKIHVPAAHAHLLSRYVGIRGEAVRLHRLDGTRWTKDKANAQRAVADLAAALLETQAKRDTAPGYAYDVNCDGFDTFEAAFPYEETPDQHDAIEAVKRDMAAARPMDRLLCGDAGYGKTEVAMRAAYIAAMNGRQTAVLAPTTVLAEQHFETFTARFDGTPIRIESCSRFQSGATHDGTFKRLANGACDIVIGTHAILSKKTRFHDLGLIIIDEEQRFGVRHKEFLKRLRATADVLTLSATPIPRTLYLSMTGARDLSLLRTPPQERVAVEIHIVRDSDTIVQQAIRKELARNGQVFFLHNRVMTLAKTERRLAALCPEARIVVAHGQMETRELADRMRAFERGDRDVLLSTTIIESGIDIPRANTILIDRADTFGIADLYQLRGRVGRSARAGHAYFILPASGDIDADARERLTALKRHGGLGGGFNLAVRDLELRGAGNLLGSEQSGHIAAVGFGLYCQLLRRTIARLRGEKVQDVVTVCLNLDFANPNITSDYIEEDAHRMSLLKRFAEAQTPAEVKRLEGEMRDRFGPLPPATREFVRVALLRTACARAGISRIDTKGMRAVFYKNGAHDVAFVRDLRGKTSRQKLLELADALRD